MLLRLTHPLDATSGSQLLISIQTKDLSAFKHMENAHVTW